ncbi:unnamed protein product [Allacma fusca]|uniref:Uncharacterized protein n=1 Tax=Allacma fusca TaxID=39272 RepID=A0A8J2KCM5_9HEXA|nr:unnamed protein product [Allacma fusca]
MKFEDIQDHYTDILAHRYEPSENGKRVACGTTMGKFLVLERDEDRNEVNVRLNVDIPNGEAVLGLDWSHPGVGMRWISVLFRSPSVL